MLYTGKLFVLTVCFSLLPLPFFGNGLLARATVNHAGQSADSPVAQPTATDQTQPSIWTRWQPNQYALADDGQALWIGASGGVVRWDKSSKTHQRYTAVDGLPHQNVYAVAVDGAGNRWFGGDGGLSQLDGNNRWSHFMVANSGLHSNLVDGIAIGADHTLWVSHGLPAGGVSRRAADGNWRWYPNRAVAVVTDYAAIQQTQNVNPLWTVAGQEIWVGYAVYTGSGWLDRTPENVKVPPDVVAVDSKGVVWALGHGDMYAEKVYRWDGSRWSVIDKSFSIIVDLTTLVVSADDTVWVGCLCIIPGPSYITVAGVGRLLEPTSFQTLAKNAPTMALLSTGNGVWAVGPGWLLPPTGALYDFQDTPATADLTDILVETTGTVWLATQGRTLQNDRLQTLQDQGTAILGDDRWLLHDPANQPTKTMTERFLAFEQAPGGDLWTAWAGYVRVQVELYLWRRHQGQWRKYPLPRHDVVITDLFAQDDRQLWVAYADPATYPDAPRGVLALNDQGTPANLSDDTWTDYPIRSTGTGGVVAVDALGRLWYGNSSGLYRYASGQWQTHLENTICDLTPAGNGALFAQLAGPNADYTQYSCDHPDQWILPIGEEAGTSIRIDALVENYLDVVRSATHRNRLWTVAPDGAVWYVMSTEPPAGANRQVLHRRAATGLTTYTLPLLSNAVRRLAVDANQHIWLLADGALWRVSPPADFQLTAQPNFWLVGLGASRHGRIIVTGQEGFNAAVTLTLSGLPSGVTATLSPNPIHPGNEVTVTMTAAPETALGFYPVTLIGASTNLTHTTALTVAVVTAVFAEHLPIITK